ncbi:hypothetical protein XJ27_17255 [Xanthomonas hortorum]|nr:hypothetical protein XJ27_17255 [Xanthomonas hortorum]
MIAPVFIYSQRHIRELQLKLDVMEIVRKFGTSETFNVLNNKCFGTQLPNNIDSGGKHIPVILMRFMLSAN